jgi:hypothetical protein
MVRYPFFSSYINTSVDLCECKKLSMALTTCPLLSEANVESSLGIVNIYFYNQFERVSREGVIKESDGE